MKNYYYYIRTIIVKIIFNLIPQRYLYSIIDILSIKEFKKLIINSEMVSSCLKWDKQKVRYNVWDKFLENENLINQKIQYFEFGVFQGESIKYFAKKLKNHNKTKRKSCPTLWIYYKKLNIHPKSQTCKKKT